MDGIDEIEVQLERYQLTRAQFDMGQLQDHLEELEKDLENAQQKRQDTQLQLAARSREVEASARRVEQGKVKLKEQVDRVEVQKARLQEQVERVEARKAVLNAADEQRRQAEARRLQGRAAVKAKALADLSKRYAEHEEPARRELQMRMRPGFIHGHAPLPPPAGERSTKEQDVVLNVPQEKWLRGDRFSGVLAVPVGSAVHLGLGAFATRSDIRPAGLAMRSYKEGMLIDEHAIRASCYDGER